MGGCPKLNSRSTQLSGETVLYFLRMDKEEEMERGGEREEGR